MEIYSVGCLVGIGICDADIYCQVALSERVVVVVGCKECVMIIVFCIICTERYRVDGPVKAHGSSAGLYACSSAYGYYRAGVVPKVDIVD